jgi:ATP-dependent helicase/nuclease subunit A
MLTVYKASAGSGKTFRLVVDYLKLALAKEKNYRHILAVTFTNKATAEMKERVVSQLHRIARGKQSDYTDILIRETGLDEQELARKASDVLENILFDYNRFSVSTIDKFTQRVIKAFNRELGISPEYQLETDNEIIINEAIDRIISTIGFNKNLRKWLEDFIDDKIRSNKSFTIEKDLASLGNELFSEKLQGKIHELQNFFSNSRNAPEYLAELSKIVSSFENVLKIKAEAVVETYRKAGLTLDDFSHKSTGVAGFLEKAAGGFVPEELGQRVLQAAASEDKWITKSHPEAEKVTGLITGSLKPMLNSWISYYFENQVKYYSARAIRKEWYTLAVLIDLYHAIAEINREKETLPLSGSNLLLKSIIDGNDAPFIYEKAGNYFHHFMLDEFQDTSVMQWENFRPLISNSLGSGYENLVVGDIKQSIYRWRNSSWEILARSVYSDFPGFKITTNELKTNYRSDEFVVTFNNLFFEIFRRQISENDNLGPENNLFTEELDSLYADLNQKFSEKRKGKGYVRVEVLEDDENTGFQMQSLRRLESQIKELQDKGFEASEIAILVRTNAQGEEIVHYFMEIAGIAENSRYNLKVLSSESLFLRSSPAVNFVITLLQFLTNKESTLLKFTLLQLYKNLSNISVPEQETPGLTASGNGEAAWKSYENEFDSCLVAKINETDVESICSSIDEVIIRICAKFSLFNNQSEIPFLQALIDKAAELVKRTAGSLPDFLQWWDEKGQSESVKISDNSDAVRLLTIHKAKGLEYKAVLIPFFNWKILERKENIIWCVPESEPFSKAPLVPLSFNKSLARTIFSADYYREVFNTIVDNLNMVYVAFTRAVSVLMINAPQNAGKDNICVYLINSLAELAKESGFRNSWNPEKNIFEFGKLHSKEAPEAGFISGHNAVWTFSPFVSRLKLRTDSSDFLEISAGGVTRKNMGKIIHSILSGIKVVSDADRVLEKAYATGMVLTEEKDTIKAQIEAVLHHPLASDWFSDDCTVFNEKNLLTTSKIHRPDRIMIFSDKAVVVDFKTGQLKNEFHNAQVRNYCNVLLDTGIENVSGYLWYLTTNEIQKVFPD